MKVGDNILLDRCEFRVLDIQNNSALIITEDIVEQRAYHNNFCDITWAECDLRKYLNGDFYRKFSADAKSKIIQVTNKNPDNPWYGGVNGGEDTQDNIFLLSLQEICKYFGDSTSILQNQGNRQYWKGNDKNNINRKATFMSCIWWWWLRSPGRVNRQAAYVHGFGSVGINGNVVAFSKTSKNGGSLHPLNNLNINGGVRPALWLSF